MPTPSRPLKEVFTLLNAEENRSISKGAPRLANINDEVYLNFGKAHHPRK